MCMPKVQGLQAQGLRAYISDNSQVPMLQIVCNITAGELKAAQAF